MEMELDSAELIVGTEDVGGDLRGEHVCAVGGIEVYLIGVPIELGVGVNLVGVSFGEGIFF